MSSRLFVVRKAFTNKVFFYMATRYLIYFLTFISSIIIANKLGPYYLGIWGFVLLLIRYFHIIDFGIGNSMTVLLVKNKGQRKIQAEYEVTSMIILGLISLIILGLVVYYYYFGLPFLEKYKLGNLIYAVAAIAIMQYFNDYLLKVYRAKGKMFEFTFYQSIIQILVFISIFFAKGEQLIVLLISAYVIGHILSLLLYIRGGAIYIDGKPSLEKGKIIVSKGFLLFIYNFCFYMIIISTKTLIGIYYPIVEFGYFTFSYTLAHAALLLLTAFSSLVTPKLIDKFNTNDVELINRTVGLLRVNYIYLSHGLMYAAMIVFPLFLILMPKYSETLQVINFTALATILYTNSFGYTSLLMTKNKESWLARNTFISLIANVLLTFILIKVIGVSYQYAVIGTIISYLIYAYLTIYSGKKEVEKSANFRCVMKECFPIGLLVPFLGAIIVTLLNKGYLMVFPFLLFICMNIKEIKEIFTSLRRVLIKPEIVDVN